jgi:hypothetical protein
VVLRGYLTGREVTAVKAILFTRFEMSMSDRESKKMGMGGLPGTLLAEQERKVPDCLIVSVDGDAATPAEKLLDLRSVDDDAVTGEIEYIKGAYRPGKSGITSGAGSAHRSSPGTRLRRGSCGERQPDPRSSLLDPECNLQQPQADGGEFSAGQRLHVRNGTAYLQHQPVGGGVQDQPYLIGERRTTTCPVRRRLALVPLDICPPSGNTWSKSRRCRNPDDASFLLDGNAVRPDPDLYQRVLPVLVVGNAGTDNDNRYRGENPTHGPHPSIGLLPHYRPHPWPQDARLGEGSCV